MHQGKNSFTGKIGFVLAAAGSAVGLGNIWRFPYLSAKYGGGIFLLVYLILALTFGFSLMIAEIAIGRKTGKSPLEAFKQLNRKWGFLGKLNSIVPIIIFPYYCVIGGWVMKYGFIFLRGQMEMAADVHFYSSYIAQPAEPILWLSFFVLATTAVVVFGVQKGIENTSKIMMPILAVLAVAIALFVVCRPEAIEGLKFYLLPDFSKFSAMTVLGAMGQLFYSMSLSMGIMITFGSYMKKTESIESCVKQIEFFDLGIAFISGLMVVPAVFAFGDGNMDAGPGLMFEVLPRVFHNMNFGNVVGTAFFLLMLMAALTSAISLMETIISVLQDRLRWNRIVSCVVTALLAIAVGIPSSLGFGMWKNVQPLNMSILDFFDFTSNSVIMPIVALLTCVFVGHVTGTKLVSDEVESSGAFKRRKMFEILIRYAAPVIIILILLSSVANEMGWIVI